MTENKDGRGESGIIRKKEKNKQIKSSRVEPCKFGHIWNWTGENVVQRNLASPATCGTGLVNIAMKRRWLYTRNIAKHIHQYWNLIYLLTT